MVNSYQITNFHFNVTFQGLSDGANTDMQFQSVSGLNVQYDTESFKEGGENRFEHVIPTRAKYSDLVLKRGIFRPNDSGITKWCKKAFDNMEFEPLNLDVALLNQNHEPLLLWKIVHAYPKNWKLADFNAEKGEVLIETFELNYNYFTMIEPNGDRIPKFHSKRPNGG